MPNTYEATDPKTGQKWTWDGKSWSPVKEGAVSRFEKGLRTSLGFEPTGGVKEDVSQIGTGLQHIFTHPIDSATLLAQGLFGSQQGLAEKGMKEIRDPNLLTKATGVGHYAESGIPMIGPMLASSGEKFASGDVAGGMGSMAPLLLPPLAERGLPAIGEAAGRVSKAGVRDVLGVGERDVEGHIAKAATKEEAAHAKAVEKVEKAKENYAGAVADVLKKRAAASAKETAAKVKQEALGSKHGPVYQRMNEMADSAQQHIGEMEQKVNKAESAKWEEFNKRMGDPPVQSQPTVDAITNAKKNILTGDSVPVFNQILNEVIKEEGAKDFIDTAGGLVPKTADIPLNLARRLYTKIGRKLGGSELPKDVTRALGSVSEALDSSIAKSVVRRGNEISDFAKQYDLNPRPPSAPGLVSFQDRVTGASIEMKKGFTEAELAAKLKEKRAEIGASELSDVAKSKAKSAGQKRTDGGAEALRDYRKLQADWKQYRQTFSDRDSPLRKIMEAKDPSTKIGPIVGETGARAIEYLGRYNDISASISRGKPTGVEQLGRIRALHKALKELPSGGAKAPTTPARPGLPEVPARQTVTPEQAREQMLAGKASSFSRPPSKWELMFPPLLFYKQSLKHLLQNPEFRKWLAKDKT